MIGSDERVPISFLENALLAQKSVARLLVPRILNGNPKGNPPESVTGTGWIIGPNILITNYHVVAARFSGEEPASDSDIELQTKRIVAWFGYNNWDANHIDYRCTGLIQSNALFDYALLRFNALSIDRTTSLSAWGQLPVSRNTPELAKGDRLNIIQHPRGEEKRLAIRSNFFVGSSSSANEPSRIQYLTDTEPGSSGSPVFDDYWNVIALHHAAIKVPETQYKGEVVKYNNQGVEIAAILRDINDEIRSSIRIVS